ncbi:MAG: S-methyl-5-thioribose-1-phosphate isomerase [Pseudomonadota bacterium]
MNPASGPAGKVVAIAWLGDALRLIDQRRLPHEENYVTLTDAAGVAEAISAMIVRGAPAIGISAAYGVVLAARAHARSKPAGSPAWRLAMDEDIRVLAESRPTAVNLFWALDRMRRVLATPGSELLDALAAEAVRIHEDDIAANLAMGRHGAALLPEKATVYTHCNTGALATGGYGTALGVIRSAHEQGKLRQVYAGETRPWMQGARLTAWELMQERIPVTLSTEGAAGQLFRRGGIDWVIVGADRITANGDVANKIGTYNLAVLAKHHGVKFMVVAPTSTIDMSLADGHSIPIEERPPEEVTRIQGVRIAPEGVKAMNPSFDVTPAELIAAIVTEAGVVLAPDTARMQAQFGNQTGRPGARA